MSSNLLLILGLRSLAMVAAAHFDYVDALLKSILFFEGQRSGKLLSSQRMTWRKDSGLQDGSDVHVSHPTMKLSPDWTSC